MRFDVAPLAAVIVLLAVGLAGCLGDADPAADAPDEPAEPEVPQRQPFVVVATLDTGVNPLHPTWIRDQSHHPSLLIPGFPADAEAVRLTWTDTFYDSINASLDELAKFEAKDFPYWIPGTNIVGTWAHETDGIPIFDVEAALQGEGGGHYHGAPAASQIAGAPIERDSGEVVDISLAPEAWIVIMDRTNQGSTDPGVYGANAAGLRWAADQPWIDIIHTNIQDPVPLNRDDNPVTPNYPEAVAYAVEKGKLVVSAGGNFWAESTETSPHAGPPGVLAAGANDNCGYADFSNPNPHVAMDGYNTVAAENSGWGEQSFGGTSSASPRTTGYAAQVLLEVRRALNYSDGWQDGYLILLDEDAPRPDSGPLADGNLHASELHEVIRKTADPNPHASKFDGGEGICIPQPADSPAAVYAKMGYGEVSEHTIDSAIAVTLGEEPMPERPVEDAFFEASERLRQAAWESL